VFIDEIELDIGAGDGGAGSVSFRRLRFQPRGGPDGGDGGRGGSVFAQADGRLRTLNHFAGIAAIRAGRGGDGGSNKRSGKAGNDEVLLVPLGTEIRDPAGNLVGELMKPGERLLLARGGKGGRGNTHFATSTLQAPRYAEKGGPGEIFILRLTLKLIADVALVGAPNAGKSSLLAVLSSANPKVAPYPFTTLAPQLGIVEVSPAETFAVVEVPGLMEGAAEGKGLGHDFLKHIERARAIAIVVDVAAEDPGRDAGAVLGELDEFNPDLRGRVHLLIANKIDLPHAAAARECLAEFGFPVAAASALTGDGVPELKRLLYESVGSHDYTGL
jgi:GTP-binding protein